MTKAPKIIIVDDHDIFRKGVISLIELEGIGKVVAEARNGLEFVQLIEDVSPDIVLMDIDMPVMNGIDATQKALANFPDLKILVFTMFGHEEYHARMVSLGVKGFLVKSCSLDELASAVDSIMDGKTHFTDIPLTPSC
jgi:DNA-binding NarL/FixJ family response regulator